MSDKRKSERVDCLNNCFLVCGEKKYKGILDNISNTGASIVLLSKPSIDITNGAPCSLMIGNDSLLIPGEFTGKIVYSNGDKIGLQFQF